MKFTAEEDRAYDYLWKLAQGDEELGVLVGESAVNFFEKSKLPVSTLGEIWQLSDSDNNGFLTADRFKVALRLIGHAQQGETIDSSLVDLQGPIPTLTGISIPGIESHRTTFSAVPRVSPEDKTRFLRTFMAAHPTNGLLDGDKARDIFIKSNLPLTQLGAIWNLADTKNRGALDATEFVIGMHLIQLSMSDALPSGGLPAKLPSSLYESATVSGAQSSIPALPVSRQATGILKPQTTGDRPLQKQHTGQRVQFSPASPSSSPNRSFFRPPSTSGSVVSEMSWDVTATEKSRSDAYFDNLDTRRTGFVEGDQAVPFFLESQLPESVLAQVWDMSDIRKVGKLSKDEFAVAMKLINDLLDGKSLPGNNALPNSLVPPMLRHTQGSSPDQARGPTAVGRPPTASEHDLFSLLDDGDGSSSPTLPVSLSAPSNTALSPQNTAGSVASYPVRNDAQSVGQDSLSVKNTLSHSANQIPQFSSRSGAGMDNLPGDDSAKMPEETVLINRTKNELNASTKGLATLSSQREEMENTASLANAELEELKDLLKASRDKFANEQKLVNELTLKSSEHRKELQKAREQLISAESDLSALREEKKDTEGALMRDKEEIRNLQSKIAETTSHCSIAKTELERLRKDAKQQKGMLAITRKQQAAAESDLERVQNDTAAFLKSTANSPDILSTREALDSSLIPSPRGQNTGSPSPAPSTRSNNPFDRFLTAQVPSTTSGTIPGSNIGSVAPSSASSPHPLPLEEKEISNRLTEVATSNSAGASASQFAAVTEDSTQIPAHSTETHTSRLDAASDDSSDDEIGDPEDIEEPGARNDLPDATEPVNHAHYSSKHLDQQERRDPSVSSSIDYFEDARRSPVPHQESTSTASAIPSTLDSRVNAAVTSTAYGRGSDDFEADFDKEFVNLSPTASGDSSHAAVQFDDEDFTMDDFDSAFGKRAARSEQAEGSAGTSGFEDSFGGTSAMPPTQSADARQATQLDDTGPVRELLAMGFSRPDVVGALEKNEHSTEKALNVLLERQ